MAKATGFRLINAVADKLHEAGLIPSPNNVTRVIIDINPRDAVKVYVESIAGESLIDIVGLLTADPAALDVHVNMPQADTVTREHNHDIETHSPCWCGWPWKQATTEEKS